MRDDEDFDAFVAARWTRVVRALVLLGGSPAEADAVARGALAGLRPGWARATAEEDPDVHAWREVLLAWRERPWRGPAPGPGDPVLAALEADLDRLTPDVRAAVVLAAVAGLAPGQVALVLERRPDATRAAAGHDLPAAAAAVAAVEAQVEVAPAPTPAVLAATPRTRRRRRPGAVAALLALVLLVGAGAWLDTRPDTRPAGPPGAPRVTRTENAAGVAWWADGTLHLPHVDVALPGVAQLVAIDGGAVVGDGEGRVRVVTADGVVTRVGHQDPREPLVGSDETGWAGWVDPTGIVPRLVVYDVTAGGVLAGLDLPDDGGGEVQPIAFDRGQLHYADHRGNWQWEPGHDLPLRVLEPGLADVAEGTQARRLDGRRIELVQPFFNVVHVVPGDDAQLSGDASYALTRLPGSGRRGLPGVVRVYDVRSGESVPTGLTGGEVAVAAAVGPGDEVRYVVGPPASGDSGSGRYELRSCHLAERRCTVLQRFARTRTPPLLAR